VSYYPKIQQEAVKVMRAMAQASRRRPGKRTATDITEAMYGHCNQRGTEYRRVLAAFNLLEDAGLVKYVGDVRRAPRQGAPQALFQLNVA